ncbi:unnamed protein product [Linum tenue]|uniref:C2 NT-type domain-containing protein n=1 Tax=Linum tenue TaxID=586396 RepID=A0AAV0JLJ7_9ROSI|nr:unnamed protein product [Linum tenue]
MFRLQKKRFDFRFSNLQALQVPKGWDKLLLSMVSVETGKTVAKSSRAMVRNGGCRWTETFSESVTISQSDASKDNQECIFKFVVAMGARNGILGEATVNLANYKSSKTAVSVSFPLRKCTHGTILQVKLQCSATQERLREEQLEDTGSDADHINLDYTDVENKSDAASVNHPDSASDAGESPNRDLKFSASGSHYNFDSPRSMDSSLSRENSSNENFLNRSSSNPIVREDLTSSLHDPSGLNHFSFSSKFSTAPRQLQSKRDDYSRIPRSVPSSPSWNGSSSSKELLETGEDSTEVLRAQAKMWEQNARKLMADVEKLQSDILDHSTQQAGLEMDLSESRKECDGLKKELDQLKILLEESPLNQLASDKVNFQSSELEDEIKFHKESNADLALQLKKTQESNIELVSLLQELEDIVEKQKMEIASFSQLQPVHTDCRSFLYEEEDESKHVFGKDSRNVICNNWDMEGLSVDEPGDAPPFFSEPEANNPMLELEGSVSHESRKHLENTIRLLERSLEEKVEELQFERTFHIQSMENEESEWKATLALKEEEIIKLEAKLSEALDPPDFGHGGDCNHVNEIKVLKLKMEELEKDCNELTNENLELLLKLKESSQSDPPTFGDSPHSVSNDSFEKSSYYAAESEVSQLKSQIYTLEEELNKKDILITQISRNNLMKDHEVEALNLEKRKMDSRISNLLTEKQQLEEKVDSMFIEDSATSRCFDDSGDEMMMFGSSMSSQASARQSPGMERCRSDLEGHLNEMEKENVQLYERICGLEAQLRYLTDESQLNRLEVEISQSEAASLREEIGRLKGELEVQKAGLRQKTQGVHKQWLEMQEECEFLKMENLKLQSSSESLMEECSVLQKSNAELKKQKMLLHEQCSVLEAELKDSEKVVVSMFKEVEALEGKYECMLQEISSKERAFILELDTLVHDNETQKEKLASEVSQLNHLYQERTVLAENLQSEVALLTAKISETHDEQEIRGSESILEVSRLRADKALLEASLQDVREKLRLSEINFSTLKKETELNLQGLREELEASEQNQEVLAADNEKLLELVEEANSSKEKQRGSIRWLELKLKAAEYDKLQVAEEMSSLESQVHKTALLQEEVLALKKSLNEVKFENQRLQASLEILSEDFEGVKTENVTAVEKISDMEKALAELEDCKRSKASLEEKVFRLELDITAKEAQGGQDAELKNELARVKITNSGLHRKMKHLEEEKQEYLKRAQALEKDLRRMKEAKLDDPHHSSDVCNNGHEDTEVPTKPTSNKGNVAIVTDPWSKIQQLENELAEASEANDMYKSQLKRLLSGQRKDHPKSMRQRLEEEEEEGIGAVGSGGVDDVEAELKDLQERFSHMSLKYAEVEAERAQLVLKLRAESSGKRWSS